LGDIFNLDKTSLGDVVHLNGKLKQERPIGRRTPAAGGTAGPSF
jgi:hypothetical protein